METVDMRPLKAEIEKIADPLSGFNRNNFDIKIVHTRGDISVHGARKPFQRAVTFHAITLVVHGQDIGSGWIP